MSPVSGTTDVAEIRSAVREYLRRFVEDTDELDCAGLISGGLLDSLAAVQLIDFVQRRFGFVVADEDLEFANFDSVDAVVAFVGRKRGGQSGA